MKGIRAHNETIRTTDTRDYSFRRSGIGMRKIHFRFVIAIVFVVSLLGGCSKKPASEPELDFLIDTEPTAYDGVAVSPERIEELRGEIAENKERVQELVSAMSRTAVVQKLLAEEFLRQEMYEPALEALESAMFVQTENAVLYYWAAVASARSAKAHRENGEVYLQNALSYYEDALAIRPDYKEALYGISVLLAFELDRPQDALPHITRLASLETAAIDVQFLHANILVRLDRYEEAIEIYDSLSRTAPSEVTKARAQDNRDRLLQEMGQ